MGIYFAGSVVTTMHNKTVTSAYFYSASGIAMQSTKVHVGLGLSIVAVFTPDTRQYSVKQNNVSQMITQSSPSDAPKCY